MTLITACIPPCRRLIDVGSDHATVPISILNRGICEQVLITDVHRGPIEVARRRVEEAGLSDVCRFVLTDGLDDVAPEEGDVLLISGLGGENIAGILERGYHKLSRFYRLIFQPQTRDYLLRNAIDRLSLTFLDERVAVENRRPYLVMICDSSIGEPGMQLSPLQMEFGPKILERVEETIQVIPHIPELNVNVRTALEVLSAFELFDLQNRARLVYLLSKYEKITRRARFHLRDQALLNAFDEWFLSLF
ncbi:MAG: class I SAM-dependent methyltransferase [Saccharofermentanales bacterium]